MTVSTSTSLTISSASKRFAFGATTTMWWRPVSRPMIWNAPCSSVVPSARSSGLMSTRCAPGATLREAFQISSGIAVTVAPAIGLRMPRRKTLPRIATRSARRGGSMGFITSFKKNL